MRHKNKSIQLFKKLLKKHSDSYLAAFESGYDDAVKGNPMQAFPEAFDDDGLLRSAKLMVIACYQDGYQQGLKVRA